MTKSKYTSIQVTHKTKEMLDEFGGKNYDTKIKRLKEDRMQREEELIKKVVKETVDELQKTETSDIGTDH